MDFQNFYNMVTRGSDGASEGGGVAPSSTTTAITSGGLSGSTSSTTSLPQPPPTHASSASRGSMDLSGSGSGLVATGPVGLPGPLSASIQSYNSADGSTSTSSGGAAHGIDVPAGPTFTFTPPPADLFPQLPCTPIALYASESAYTSGGLITVSDTYICYAIKDGHIRAINRHSVIRTLLKGHKKPVSDLAFAAGSNNTLVSLAGDGSAIVWRLLERAVGADGSKVELTYAVVLHITDIGLSRAVWHPQHSDMLAIVKANEACVLDYTQLLPEGSSTTTPVTMVAATLNDLKPDYKLPSHQNLIQDISFSKDGRYLATAGADGWVRVYDTEQRSIVGRWQPYGGAAATRVLFLHRTAGPAMGEKVFLCTGGKMDSELKLWRAWTTLVPTCTQTITIEDQDAKGHGFHLEGDDTGEFIFIADSLRPVLYVSSVTLTPSSARIHRITPFQLKHPVLSLLSKAGVSINAHEGPLSAEIQLYCVQTQAIQLYHLKAADCKAPPTTTPTTDGPASSLSLPTPPSPPTDTTTPNTNTTVTTSSSDMSSSSLSSSSAEDGSQGGGITPPAPPNTPSTTVEPPAILKMLLQATAAKDNSTSASASGSGGGGGAVPPTQPPPPTLLTPSALSAGTLPVPHQAEETVTQRTSTPATEEKQTGGAHTTEQQQQQESGAQPPSSASGEATSSAATAEGATPTSTQNPSAGQGSRDAPPTAPLPPQSLPSLPTHTPTTHATPPPHPPSIPPPSAPPAPPLSAPAIPPPTGSSSSVSPAVPSPPVPPPPVPPQLIFDDTKFARVLAATESRIAQGVANATAALVFDDAKFARVLAATESRIAQGVANATAAMAEEFERRTRAVVAQALAGFGPDLQQGVSASVAQSVTQRLDKSVRSTVAHHIDNIVPNLINKSMVDMTQAVAASVRDPVLVSFKQCFAEQLIPAVSSATQRMFAQFNDALTKGLAGPASSGEAVQQQLVALRSDVSSLTMAVGTLTGQLEGLSEKLDSLSTTMAAAGGGEGAGGMLGPAVLRGGSGAGTPAARSQTKDELKRVMRQGFYDDAFKQALGASDLELVTWLCGEAPKDDIFDAEPPLLSPTVLLCLMQQLSFNLDLDTPLKLEWLKQISLVLNIADPEIAALPVGGVLDQLHQNLEGAAALLRGANDVRDLRFVHKAVRRMMQDHKARRPS